jgi:hypothetical protein
MSTITKVKIKGKLYEVEQIYNPNIEQLFIRLKGKEGSYINGVGYHYDLFFHSIKKRYILKKQSWEERERVFLNKEDIELIKGVNKNVN